MGKKGKGKEKEAAKVPETTRVPEPEYKPKRIDPRKVRATVKLAAPVCSLLEFKLELSPSHKINYIIEKIIDRHGGSIRELSVCVNRFHPEEIVSPDMSLEDCGVQSGDCIVYYDFVPTSGALLA
jgi:hypothetical protein